MSVTVRMIEQDYLFRAPREPLAKVRVNPAFPVAVAKCGSGRSNCELVRNEVVMCDSVCREVGEVAQSKRAHRLRLCFFVDLEADVPRVTMPAGSCVLLG